MPDSISRRDELGRGGAGDQHGADDDVGREALFLERLDGRVARVDAAVEEVVELAQARDRAVEDGDVGAEADRHAGGVQADDAAADHGDLARQHAGNAAEQHAAAAIGLLQRRRAGLDRQAAGDFRHRREQRQAAAIVGDGLVGDGGDAGGEQARVCSGSGARCR